MNEELRVIISAEINKLTQTMENAKNSIKNFKQQVADASKDVDAKMKSLGTSIANGMKAAAKGLAAFGAALVATIPATHEYRQSMNQVDAAFKQAGLSAESASSVYDSLYKVIGDHGQVTEASQQIALLANSEQEAAKWAEVASGVIATFGGALQPETFFEAANATIKLGEATGAYTQMLEQAGFNVEEFNEKMAACKTESERAALALDYTIAATSEAGIAYDKANAPIQNYNAAMLNLQKSLAPIADAVLPIVTVFLQFAGVIANQLSPYLQNLSDAVLPVLTEALSKAAEATGAIFGFIADNWEILAGIAAVILGIVAAIGLYNAVAAVKAAMAALEVTTVWALVSAYAAQAAAMIVAIAPYVLIVAAIAAVVAAIYLLVKNWDDVVEHTKAAWEFVKEYVSEGVENAKAKFNELKQGLIDGATAIGSGVRNKFVEIKNNITGAIGDAKSKAIDGFNDMKSKAGSKIGEIATNVSSKFNTIKSKISTAIGDARDAVDTAIGKIKSAVDFSWDLPKLKMPSISVSGKFSLNPPSAPRFSISWNKLGGVFDKPTLFNYGGSLQGIGEDGAEAVVPLEKNTQWLDRIAERLQGNGTPIVIQVDGKVFAETAINTINANTKQTGKLNLIYT